MPEQNEDYSYKIIELSGSSSVSIEEAVQNATGKPISSRVCRNEAGSEANRRSVKVAGLRFDSRPQRRRALAVVAVVAVPRALFGVKFWALASHRCLPQRGCYPSLRL